MNIYIFTFFIIVVLILTNAITDAPNAISTIVGTKTMKFKNAAILSAAFNFLGTFTMSFVSISVANCISSIVKFENGVTSILGLGIAMFSVIIFALIAMWFGIPTSETHGLIAGLTGSSIALYGIEAINFEEWKNVIIGLIWSILGTYLITKLVARTFKKYIENIKEMNVRRFQIYGCCAMSFIHRSPRWTKIHRNFNIIFFYYKQFKNRRSDKSLRTYLDINICFDINVIWNFNRRKKNRRKYRE